MTAWHQFTSEEVLERLESDPDQGLTSAAAAERRAQYGHNELLETRGRGLLTIVWEQLRNAMVLLLVAAALVSLYLQEFKDAAAILAIVVLNAALGFFQDYRAEKALAALKRLAVPTVKVRREGIVREMSSRELVPGDIVLLDVGNFVPADCRLLESVNLKIQESALTGESEPVEKSVEALEAGDLPLGDRTNLAYMATVVTYGHGQAVVIETGMNTELGQIARSLQTVGAGPTPLQLRLAQLSRTLAVAALGIVAVVYVLGLMLGEEPELMLMTALSMAVAVVPEGLPAVATVVLALGARRMYKRHALIRRLPAVETLGSVTVICSDKTGTLTENRMTVTVLDVAGKRIELTESLRRDTVMFADEDEESASLAAQVAERSSLALLLAGAGLCNDAELHIDRSRRLLRAVGDPTEAALAVAAARLGFPKNEITQAFPRVGEVPFDSERKRMTTVHAVKLGRLDPQSGIRHLLAPIVPLDEADHLAFTKGAVDTVLDVCQYVWDDDEPKPLDDLARERIERTNDQLAGSGMRVLGVAFRPVDEVPSDDAAQMLEQELIFIGLLAMIDPPRQEVKEAVMRCRAAGIRPIMITGDHPLTAIHIARQLGVADGGDALTGQQLAGMTAAELESSASQVAVYARVSPNDKLRIVQALQSKGQVVAMTGDGVNDAPALKQAHIGVAMGQIGTDVSKEASEMVLLDDNFATIVNAVEEGRIVYDNIRKFVKYTMTSNAGEVWVMVLGPLLGMPLPLLPLQILWINLVTDGLPGLAMAVEPAERNTMQRPPYPPTEHVFGRGIGRDIAWIGLLMGIVSLALGYGFWAWEAASEAHWRTIVFTVLTLSQMGNALAIRAARDSLFQIGLLSNKVLLGSVLLTFVLQLAVIYLPALQSVFKTSALSPIELIACLLLSSVVFWAVELQKWFLRRRTPDKN